MFGGGKLAGKSPQEILEKYRAKNGSYVIYVDRLAEAVGINPNRYVDNFVPSEDVFSTIMKGRGGAVGVFEGVGSFVTAMNRASLNVKFALSGFYADEADEELLCGLQIIASLASKGDINKSEFVRAAASMLFDDGRGKADFVKYDKLGAPAFKNDKERAIAAMAFQFFKENCVPVEQVRQMIVNVS